MMFEPSREKPAQPSIKRVERASPASGRTYSGLPFQTLDLRRQLVTERVNGTAQAVDPVL